MGDCFNQVRDVTVRAYYNNSQTQPHLFRLISQWQHTREDYLRLMLGVMTQAQIDANKHMWMQSRKNIFKFTNCTNSPCFFRLYRLTVGCDDPGPVAGAFVPNVLPFVNGSALAAAAAPDGTYWNTLWTQDMRTTGADAAVPLTTDSFLAYNIDGNVVPPIAGSQWETENDNQIALPTPHRFNFNTPLNFIFPRLRARCKVKVVGKGWLAGGASKSFTDRLKAHAEIRPRDILDNAGLWPNFKKGETHCYLLRAHSVPASVYTNYAAGGAAAISFMGTDCMKHVQLRMECQRVFSVRSDGDNKPTYLYTGPNGAWIAGASLWSGAACASAAVHGAEVRGHFGTKHMTPFITGLGTANPAADPVRIKIV